MENLNNGGTNSDRKEISDKGSKPSDKGSWPLSNNGQRPTPPSSNMPPLKKPKK